MCTAVPEIGSSVNSQHVADNGAAAADFEIPGVDNRELARWIRSELDYDQLIFRILPRQRTVVGMDTLFVFD